MKSYIAKAQEVERKGYVVDAAGKPLGRVASQGASILRGKIPASSISDIIAKKDRTLAGDCVPPNGLLLKEVYY